MVSLQRKDLCATGSPHLAVDSVDHNYSKLQQVMNLLHSAIDDLGAVLYK